MNAKQLSNATSITDVELNDLMQYHPWNSEQITNGSFVREALGNAIKTVIERVPPCEDRDVAIRKIREARMDANSAITHGGKF